MKALTPFAKARNPIFALPGMSVRDPAAVYQDGVFYLYFTRPEERAASRKHPGNHCRLWWLKSSDLMHWSEPVLISAEGCTSKWANSPRQIDPYVLETKGQYYLYFKASGATGCWRSTIPTQPTWALGGFTAHFVLDLRQELGGYLMLFHGERCDFAHPTADVGKLGLAWSEDLREWHFA